MELSTKSPNDLKRRIRDAAKVSNKMAKNAKPNAKNNNFFIIFFLMLNYLFANFIPTA